MYCYYKCSVALLHGAGVGMQCVIATFPVQTHLVLEWLIKNTGGLKHV